MARKPKSIALNYPTSPGAYERIPGKAREYRIKETGQTVSRRSFLTATRGMSNEAYTKAPAEIKKAPSRGGRGKPSKKRLDRRNGTQYGDTYTWVINYNREKWARFFAQCLQIALGVLPSYQFRFFVQIKGDGKFSPKSGIAPKKGRLKWFSSEIYELSEIQMNGLQETLDKTLGNIDYPIVKKIRMGLYPVGD